MPLSNKLLVLFALIGPGCASGSIATQNEAVPIHSGIIARKTCMSCGLCEGGPHFNLDLIRRARECKGFTPKVRVTYSGNSGIAHPLSCDLIRAAKEGGMLQRRATIKVTLSSFEVATPISSVIIAGYYVALAYQVAK